MIATDHENHGTMSTCMPVVYWGYELLGEGIVVELTRDGTRFAGNYLAATGTLLQLILYLPGNPTPLYVTQAVVRFVRGRELDVEFLTVPEQDQARLDAFWSDHRPTGLITCDHGRGHRPLSRNQEGVKSMAHILVIDDEEPIRGLLRSILERAGHEVTDAPNGRQGLAAYRAKPADLVITDLCMPEMNGVDLILELTHAFLNVKVIAISGTPDREQTLDRAKLLGVRYTLQKPFSRETLLKAVDYELAH
ncbi:MAG TPA: response regulator [Nitrospira sp.]|nr:response regulator [Nitrospira sp.]